MDHESLHQTVAPRFAPRRAQNEILSSYAEKSSSGKAKKSQLSQIKGNSWRTRFFVLVGGPMPRVRYFGTKDDCGRNTRRIS